jgi:ubiquinone/menaquinone biosynthesis C-methylase UbiE
MNFKMLFPTYRNRFQFVMQNLEKIDGQGAKTLHVGCGEGDYDVHIVKKTGQLIAGDLNEADVAFAQRVNNDFPAIEYQVLDALDLQFEDATFELVIAVDTIEHVGKPLDMLQEISRVLRPKGVCLLTFPRKEFPFTYDPINYFRQRMGQQPISQGAYAFNHSYLLSDADWKNYCEQSGLVLERKAQLSGWLIALIEMYWTGWVQRIFKANADNAAHQNNKKAVRSDGRLPPMFVTDLIIRLDRMVNFFSKKSVGLGLVLRKMEAI